MGLHLAQTLKAQKMSVHLLWKEPGIPSQALLGIFKKRLLNSDPAVQSSKALKSASRKGIGHSGTLDPFAEGILCVGVGEGTKILSALVGLSKTYVVEMILGATSETLDTESDLVLSELSSDAIAGFTRDRLSSFLESQIGQHQQVPPLYSAVKIDGRRAYDYARKGDLPPELKPRQIEILSAKHLGIQKEDSLWIWSFEVSVSSGTYIRALARDWGIQLSGAPGTLRKLVRTKMGPWSMDKRDSEVQEIRLTLNDFEGLMPAIKVSAERSEGLKKYGRWSYDWVEQQVNAYKTPSQPGKMPIKGFLVVSEGGQATPEPVALLTPDGGLQRVFLGNPFI